MSQDQSERNRRQRGKPKAYDRKQREHAFAAKRDVFGQNWVFKSKKRKAAEDIADELANDE